MAHFQSSLVQQAYKHVRANLTARTILEPAATSPQPRLSQQPREPPTHVAYAAHTHHQPKSNILGIPEFRTSTLRRTHINQSPTALPAQPSLSILPRRSDTAGRMGGRVDGIFGS
ncbi:hypothetical protein CC80DRAFT_119223 [Byssothecium circinans]|uniref:Uncharacterized protein n=1 Tax=Byssothecium circinans TaxID=147558 RepID=A0A6A5TS65_9PLEO|nr:hypothetical protein CC80DRAFT_119223 [Byssothecium circinans]